MRFESEFFLAALGATGVTSTAYAIRGGRKPRFAPVDLMGRREYRVPLFVSVGASRGRAPDGAIKPEWARIQAREAFPDPGASNVHAETEGRVHRSTLAAAPSCVHDESRLALVVDGPPRRAWRALLAGLVPRSECVRRATLRWTQWACPVGGPGRAATSVIGQAPSDPRSLR